MNHLYQTGLKVGLYAHIRSQVDVIRAIIIRMIYADRDARDGTPSYLKVGERTYSKGIQFEFNWSLRYYDFNEDGNTKAGLGERSANVTFSVVFAGSGVLWMGHGYSLAREYDRDEYGDAMLGTVERVNLHPDYFSLDTERAYTMTGNHSSCWADGFDNYISDVLTDLYFRVCPEEALKNRTRDPVSWNFSAPMGNNFANPVWVHHEVDEDHYREHHDSYLRKIMDMKPRG